MGEPKKCRVKDAGLNESSVIYEPSAYANCELFVLGRAIGFDWAIMVLMGKKKSQVSPFQQGPRSLSARASCLVNPRISAHSFQWNPNSPHGWSERFTRMDGQCVSSGLTCGCVSQNTHWIGPLRTSLATIATSNCHSSYIQF